MLSALRIQAPRLSLRQFSTTLPALEKTLYVGNLAWTVKEDELRSTFEEFGEVTNSRIVTDRLSGRSRGFAFVDFAEDSAASVAAEEMNGKDLSGRALTVNLSTPREPREPGSYGGGERRSYGGNSRGGYGDDRSGGRGGYRGGRSGGDRGGYSSGGGDRGGYSSGGGDRGGRGRDY